MTQPAAALPERFRDVEQLEDVMTTPSPGLLAQFGELAGDLIILGVGGKIGPTLARLARRAAPGRRVVGVARFSEQGVREQLAACGVACLTADLLDRKAVEAPPQLPNVIFMAGRKGGSPGHQGLTWAME